MTTRQLTRASSKTSKRRRPVEKARKPSSVRRCFFIAEAGINHNGDFQLACELATAAKEIGADAVKFQSFTAETLALRSALSASHVDTGLGIDGTIFDLLKRLELSEDQHRRLAAHCEKIGIEFLSTPLNLRFVQFLAQLGVRRMKVASMDLTNHVLLEAVGRTGRPVILSTGMGTLGEVEAALATLRRAGSTDVTILHCVSLYPPKPEDVHLRAMDVLRDAFGCPVGYSDHTMGIAAAVAAVARGASVIEKHLTLDRTMPGPDQAISADVDEFRMLVSLSREIETVLGEPYKRPAPAELKMREAFRRSIVTTRAVRKGEALSTAELDLKRPGTGLDPSQLTSVRQGVARRDLPADHLLARTDIEWPA